MPHSKYAHLIARAFPGISAMEVEALIARGLEKEYSAGTILCHEGAHEEVFYLILEGMVEVTKVINDMESRHLKQLGPGEFFGEMALIHNAPRAATVTAITPLTVLEIDRDAFEQVLQRSSSVSLALVREISRRLRENDEMAIEDLRLRARELAEAYQKLAEQELWRREFLTNIAHHLRTPLTSIQGYLQLLQQGAVPASQSDHVLEILDQNVRQIVHLVNGILFLQEIDLILDKFQPVDLVALVEEVVAGFQERAARQQVVFRLQMEKALPPIPADARHLGRALSELIDNAIKFSPEGGKVEIGLKRIGDWVEIAVQDEGIGIAPENLASIFDRYHHLDGEGEHLFEGVGLGLAIAGQVIKQHRGEIRVESQVGKGSIFTIRLRIGES